MNCIRLHLAVKTIKGISFEHFLLRFLLRFLVLGAVPKNKEARQLVSTWQSYSGHRSEFTAFCIAVIASVRHNHMVSKVDAHDFCGLFHALGQHVIVLARMKAS